MISFKDMGKCVFCKIVSEEIKAWKVFENDHALAFLDIHPASKYHTLVIPKKHYENIFDIPDMELKEVIGIVKKLTTLYKTKLGIENVQIINSSGSEAQQDVFHFHFHIVPRKSGDGQDIVWKTHPEWTATFDRLISDLK
ncbi:HIT family protein [Candidatus Parcubacteria bacterium]|nr:HIT family protein [Candidatus Parcubacteria bacterium]